jgi:hypothetical protein
LEGNCKEKIAGPANRPVGTMLEVIRSEIFRPATEKEQHKEGKGIEYLDSTR